MNRTQKLEQCIADCFLFASLSEDEKRELLKSKVSEVRIKKGETVCLSGSVFIICEGRASVKAGKTLIKELREGNISGCAGLFGGDSVSEICALCDLTLAVISRDDMTGLLCSHPAVSMAYIRFLSERIRYLNGRLDDLSGDAKGRLVSFLCKKDASDMTMTELSKRLGIGRTSLYRAVDELCAEGVAERTDKGVKLRSKGEVK